LGQIWSRCNNGLDCFGAVKYVEKLLGCTKTGCIALPEYLVAPFEQHRKSWNFEMELIFY